MQEEVTSKRTYYILIYVYMIKDFYNANGKHLMENCRKLNAAVIT